MVGLAGRERKGWWLVDDVLLLMAEILRSPVEVGSLSHYLQGFIHPNGGFLAGFLVAINRSA